MELRAARLRLRAAQARLARERRGEISQCRNGWGPLLKQCEQAVVAELKAVYHFQELVHRERDEQIERIRDKHHARDMFLCAREGVV